MNAHANHPPPLWIEPGDPLPDPLKLLTAGVDSAEASGAGLWPAGLLAAGQDLSAARLQEAYRLGLFPWFNEGQPVLWWSPDPRMVLMGGEFKLRRSLIKTIRQWQRSGNYRVTLDQAFDAVIGACAEPRANQDGTWITSRMRHAYNELHHQGLAHSVEIWRLDQAAETFPQARLIGGLYGVSLGRMFYGESMFSRQKDASKIALTCLVSLLQHHSMPMLDCQQNTGHLASLGAREISRTDFLRRSRQLAAEPSPDWSSMSIEFPSL